MKLSNFLNDTQVQSRICSFFKTEEPLSAVITMIEYMPQMFVYNPNRLPLDTLDLDAKVWEFVIMDYITSAERDSNVVQDIEQLPYIAINYDIGALVEFSHNDANDEFLVTEIFKDGRIIENYFPNFHMANNFTYRRGFRDALTPSEFHTEMSWNFNALFCEAYEIYHKAYKVQAPSETNIEMFISQGLRSKKTISNIKLHSEDAKAFIAWFEDRLNAGSKRCNDTIKLDSFCLTNFMWFDMFILFIDESSVVIGDYVDATAPTPV
ncbi:hypothetical protein OH460_07585 [Vibrio sp. Makdt]|uniref:hypothetical protein n=1 Tax=Vibrio sp. Makdt TaxID=2998828 RepID=UPI0022CD4BEC|nr:hypothetical protein [Vibrio sp. Makdt]MDA0152159.1 hypothetical protein [Vibrio sp. Makdt]